jgi:hypothetical protein
MIALLLALCYHRFEPQSGTGFGGQVKEIWKWNFELNGPSAPVPEGIAVGAATGGTEQ